MPGRDPLESLRKANEAQSCADDLPDRFARQGFCARCGLVLALVGTADAGDRLVRSVRPASSARLLLTFEGVRELRIGDWVEGVAVLLVEITWIGDRQLEDLNDQVHESEYNAISFKCKTFTARIDS